VASAARYIVEVSGSVKPPPCMDFHFVCGLAGLSSRIDREHERLGWRLPGGSAADALGYATNWSCLTGKGPEGRRGPVRLGPEVDL
jgi:hypothetical protein